jgi:LPS O-antigen subunit length determinant protein (WzzB/FepE family)
MNFQKHKTSIDEISVLAILNNLWKDKVLILIISLLFSCVFG